MNKALIIPDKKKILLRDSHPSRLTTVIPTAKQILYKGVDLVVVPHELDEVKVLNNMGYDIPSPVSHYYNWSGRYTPFHAQQVTVDRLTLNPRMFVLSEIGCVDSETEYLSPTGWQKISSYSGGAVMQYWPETGKADFVDTPEYVKLPCTEMIKIKTKYGIDQLLSPEHRMLLEDAQGQGKREVIQAADLLLRQGEWHSRTYKKSRKKIGFSKCGIPVTFSGPGGVGLALTNEELRVQIAVVADGHFPPNGTSRVVIRLKKQRKKDRLRQLLTCANIEWKETSNDTAAATGFTAFSFYAPLKKKEFGTWAWDMTVPQLRVVCDEVMHWDGSISDSKPTERFSTTAKSSADFVQYAFSSTGRTARIITSDRTSEGKPVEHTVLVRNNGRSLFLSGSLKTGEDTTPITVEPSTDGFKYCFMVPSTFLVLRRNGCVFCTGNTGKSLSALWAYDYLRSQGKATKLLIISPLSTLERVWADEIFNHLPHLQAVVLYGSAARRVAQLEYPADVYIINHDGLKVPEIKNALYARKDINAIIIDELASFRNASTDRWKALKHLIEGREYVWGMTGTPIPNRPTDAWAQCRLIAPHKVSTYFGRFREMVERKVSQFKWVPRENALEIVQEAMQPSVLFRRDECVDLPPTMYEHRYVEMSPEQKKAYKQMVNQLVVEAAEGKIVAVNEAVKAAKLAQISLGCCYGQNGEVIHLECKDRIEVLKEVVEESAGKVIVFVPLLGGLEMVAKELSKDWQTAVVHGGVGKAERDQIFGEFQSKGGLHVIVAHPKCMSHGLTLVEANTIVWFIPTNNHEDYIQANGRIVRPGQKRNTLIFHLEGSEIERRMYKRLQARSSMQGLLLDLIKKSM